MNAESPRNENEKHEFKPNSRFDDEYLIDLQYRMNKMSVQESSIPLQVLYNPQVDEIKRVDLKKGEEIRPLIFSYKYN